MNRDEYNRRITEEVFGKCWHEPKSAPAKWGWELVARCSRCSSTYKCDSKGVDAERLNFFTDSDAATAFLKKVAEVKTRELLTVLIDFAERQTDSTVSYAHLDVIALATMSAADKTRAGIKAMWGEVVFTKEKTNA